MLPHTNAPDDTARSCAPPAGCRWSVCFAQPPQPPQPPPSTPTRKLASMVRHGLALKSGGGSTGQAAAAPGGGSAAGSAGGGATASKPPVIRQLNNYLGVGVDAKVRGRAWGMQGRPFTGPCTSPTRGAASAVCWQRRNVMASCKRHAALEPWNPAPAGMPAAPPCPPQRCAHASPPAVTCQVALEFHAMREQYPSFFTSQLGNKLWWAQRGAGARAWLAVPQHRHRAGDGPRACPAGARPAWPSG